MEKSPSGTSTALIVISNSTDEVPGMYEVNMHTSDEFQFELISNSCYFIAFN